MPRSSPIHVDDAKRVGQRLKEAREAAGLSQRALAGPYCSSAYISRIESGERVPSLQLIHEFARRLRVSPQYLAAGVENGDGDGELMDAGVALRLGELDQARELYKKRISLDPDEPAALAGLGEIALREGNVTRAVELLEQALRVRGDRLLDDPSSVDSLARAYAMSGELDAAIALLERATIEAERKDAPVELLRFRVLLANALVDTGQVLRAEQTLALAIDAAGVLRDPIATARVYWSQGRLHTHLKDPQLGARYMRRAIEILERTENDTYVAMAYHLLAIAEIEAGNPGVALQQLERGRKFFGSELMPRDDAKFALEEARALLALGRAATAAEKAADTLEKLHALDPQDQGRAYIVLGDVFHASGHRARALELYQVALEILEGGGKPYVMEAGTRLAELLEEEGRPKDALAVLKRAVAASRGDRPYAPSPTSIADIRTDVPVSQRES